MIAQRSTKGDSLELDQLTALVASKAWAQIQARLTAELDRSIHDASTIDKWEDVLKAQGRIAALRLAIHVPAILIDEIRVKLKQQRSKGAG